MSKVITRKEIETLNKTDIAFEWSAKNDSIENMQIVLRANGFCFSKEEAEFVIFVAKQATNFNNIAWNH